MIWQPHRESGRAAIYRRSVPSRALVWLVATFILAIAIPLMPARADLRVDITRGQVEPMPVAVSDLFGESDDEAKFGRRIAEVVARKPLQVDGIGRSYFHLGGL